MLRRKFTSLSRDSEMKASFHYLSLLGALYNFIFSLSQNDYPRFFSERLLARPFKELKRFVSFYPSTSKSTRFLYYFCLCKSFKELSILPPTQIFWRKRVQRYKKYQYPPNFKAKKFPKTRKFSGIITNSSLPYILYIMYVRGFTRVVQRF